MFKGIMLNMKCSYHGCMMGFYKTLAKYNIMDWATADKKADQHWLYGMKALFDSIDCH